MSLIPAIAESNFLKATEIINEMTEDQLNLVTNGKPPMTFYDIALQQDKEVQSKSSKKICDYMRNKGAKTYEELLAEPMRVNNRNIPLAIRGPRVNITRGIASLPRRKIPKLGGGGYSRKRKQTRRFRKFVKHIY